MLHIFSRWLLLCFIISTSFMVLAQDDEDSEPLVGQAFINTVTVDTTDDGIQLLMTGDFPDTCTELGDITQSIDDNSIIVIVETLTPTDVVCGQALTPFEISYELDISELEDGMYTLDVNGVAASLELGDTEQLTCPEETEDTVLFDDGGICFLYPVDFTVLAGRDFIFISQPRTSNAVMLISFEDADEITLGDIQAETDEDLDVVEMTLGGTDALIFEEDASRSAMIIVNDVLYQVNVQPLGDDNFSDDLWTLVTETIFFPIPEEE